MGRSTEPSIVRIHRRWEPCRGGDVRRSPWGGCRFYRR